MRKCSSFNNLYRISNENRIQVLLTVIKLNLQSRTYLLARSLLMNACKMKRNIIFIIQLISIEISVKNQNQFDILSPIGNKKSPALEGTPQVVIHILPKQLLDTQSLEHPIFVLRRDNIFDNRLLGRLTQRTGQNHHMNYKLRITC